MKNKYFLLLILFLGISSEYALAQSTQAQRIIGYQIEMAELKDKSPNTYLVCGNGTSPILSKNFVTAKKGELKMTFPHGIIEMIVNPPQGEGVGNGGVMSDFQILTALAERMSSSISIFGIMTSLGHAKYETLLNSLSQALFAGRFGSDGPIATLTPLSVTLDGKPFSTGTVPAAVGQIFSTLAAQYAAANTDSLKGLSTYKSFQKSCLATVRERGREPDAMTLTDSPVVRFDRDSGLEQLVVLSTDSENNTDSFMEFPIKNISQQHFEFPSGLKGVGATLTGFVSNSAPNTDTLSLSFEVQTGFWSACCMPLRQEF